MVSGRHPSLGFQDIGGSASPSHPADIVIATGIVTASGNRKRHGATISCTWHPLYNWAYSNRHFSMQHNFIGKQFIAITECNLTYGQCSQFFKYTLSCLDLCIVQHKPEFHQVQFLMIQYDRIPMQPWSLGVVQTINRLGSHYIAGCIAGGNSRQQSGRRRPNGWRKQMAAGEGGGNGHLVSNP